MSKRNVRIAIRDSTDSHNVGFFDNKSGIKYNAANLTQFLKGACSVLVLTYHSKKMIAQSGQKLAFRFEGKDFWLNINSVKKTGYKIELTAYSLSLEANKEKRGPHRPAGAMTIKQYIDYYDPEHSFVIGINEVADKSIKLEWSGTDTILARLYSVANSFGAELEFVTELNDDYSLKRHVVNIYREGNFGKDKTGMPVRVGEKLKVINYSDNMDDFYTAIKCTGKDGLTIAGLDRKIYDDEGRLLFFSKGDIIYAQQARDKYPSISPKGSDGYILLEGESTEFSSKEALFGYMLSELKKHCELKVDYEVEGTVDGNIGDRKTLIDARHFDPPLYVQARIGEQTKDILETSNVKTTLSNYVRKSSQIANELLQRVEQLAFEATPYTIKLATNNGIIFKNTQGQSTVYPTLKKGSKTVECTWQWLVNNQAAGTSATFEVEAAGMSSKLALTAIALVDNKEVAREQVTFTNVNDGKSGAKGENGSSLRLFTTNYRYSQTLINQYSTDGYVSIWNVNENTADVKAGDSVQMRVFNTDKNSNSWIIASVESVNGANGIKTVSKGLIDKGDKGDPGNADGTNLLPNTDFKKLIDVGKQFTINGKTYKVKTLDKWYNSYNEGIPNPTTNWHGYFNEEKFNETVFEFNESNGIREWKGLPIFFKNDSRFSVGKYTFSADVNATGLGTHLEVGFYYYNKAGVRYFHAGLIRKAVTSVNAWSRISLELKINDDVDFSREFGFYIYGYPFTSNSILYMKRPKLSNSNWSPAVEDTEEKIVEVRTSFEKTVKGLKTDITAIKTYVDGDSERREKLEQYTREETARSTEALRKEVINGYVTQTNFQKVKETAQLYERIIGSSENDIVKKITRLVTTNELFQVEVSKNQGLTTVQKQVAGSWAIQNLNSNGDIISQINATGPNVRIKGESIHLDGKTLIDDASIDGAKIKNLSADKITSGTLDAAKAKLVNVDASSVTSGVFRGLIFKGGRVESLDGTLHFDLNQNALVMSSDTASIRRVKDGHPTQFIRYETERRNGIDYTRTIIGSNRNGNDSFNSATFAGVVVENSNRADVEDSLRLYGDTSYFRHAQGEVGWNLNAVTQRLSPATWDKESEIWASHFVAPDKQKNFVRLDISIAALWDIWNHIIYNNFTFSDQLKALIKGRHAAWKFESANGKF